MRYEKPIVNVIDLQIKENIAAVDTTVYKGTGLAAAANAGAVGSPVQIALTEANTGISAANSDGLVAES